MTQSFVQFLLADLKPGVSLRSQYDEEHLPRTQESVQPEQQLPWMRPLGESTGRRCLQEWPQGF